MHAEAIVLNTYEYPVDMLVQNIRKQLIQDKKLIIRILFGNSGLQTWK